MRDTWSYWEHAGPRLLIVDNTPDRAWEHLATEKGWDYFTLGHNLGVSGSWNIARAGFLAQSENPHDLLFLFSSSVQWVDGLAVVMHDLNEAANWKGCQTGWGGHGFAYSAELYRQAGDFDENFYPGYYGDNDFWYRGIVDGWLTTNPDPIPQIKTAGPEPENGRAIRRLGIPSNNAACLAHYCAKWGGPPTEEQFTSPFDSGLPTSWHSHAYRPGLQHVDAAYR